VLEGHHGRRPHCGDRPALFTHVAQVSVEAALAAIGKLVGGGNG